jgi:hypothetical protein
MKKKVVFTLAFLIPSIAALFFYFHRKCEYPVFDLLLNGEVVTACFAASEIINHEHKDSLILEIISPHVTVSGKQYNFENASELSLFACQIIFHKRNKRPTLYDLSAANSLPKQRVVSVQNRTLFISTPGQFQIIDRLFCMTSP